MSLRLAPFAVAVALPLFVSCGGSDDDDRPDVLGQTADADVQAAWVEIGANGQTIARAVTTAGTCPKIGVDGRVATMGLRVAAGTVAQRTTASDPADSKPSAFPVTTCETLVAASTTDLAVAGRRLPLPKAEPQRIAVLADTGCRMKKADNAWQACNDVAAWPLATIAATIAAMKPDLVMHIGDYHYRENACPADLAGCKDSPWGYGWDTWAADLFTPAAPLFQAAPWVVTRGNHEECARAGQGWMRLLDVHPYTATTSCDLPANDTTANFSEPYAVALGGDTQIVLFDSAKAGTAAFGASDYRFPIYQAQFRTVATLAADPTKTTIFANHHPILAFAPIAGGAPLAGNVGLQAVMRTLNPTAYYPDGVKIALHGHVHDFQALGFSSAHPATFVTGNGGDNVDVNLPDPLPATATPAPGVVVDQLSHTNAFGFMMMERAGAQWLYKAYTRDGKLLTTCTPSGAKVACDKTGFLAPAPIAQVGETPRYAAIVPAVRPLEAPDPARVALGRRLFADPRLSQPQGTSCASCHDPAAAFAGFNGGRDGVARGSLRTRLGTRNPPSLTYARYVPPLYFYQDDDAQVPSPFGGLMLDGRVDTLAAQAREPLLARHEMNLGTPKRLAERLKAAGYVAVLEAAFGVGVLADPVRAIDAVAKSLEAYLQSDELAPFDSRFDDFLRGEPALTPLELRGLAVFRDPDRGNCASCHSVSVTSSDPARSLFTDFGYEALGVPRNARVAIAGAPDLGLCSTARARRWPDADGWCGYFRTPSLRNVAVRTRFMHNGVLTSLRQAVRFYATRSTNPAEWYGTGPVFDDLPAAMRGNVNVVSTPLNRKAGSTPALTDADVDAVVAFLGTLTDRRDLKRLRCDARSVFPGRRERRRARSRPGSAPCVPARTRPRGGRRGAA